MALGRNKRGQEYAGESYLKSVIDERALIAALERNDWGGEKRSAQKWFSGTRPEPKYVWDIGEALRLCKVAGASGFAALWIFDRPAEAAAILAKASVEALSLHRGALIAMVATAPLLSLHSVYDSLPLTHRVLNGEADEWSLRQLADTEIVKPKYVDFQSEADLLNARFRCRRIWRADEDLSSQLHDAARQWYRSADRSVVQTFPEELRAAYYVGSSSSPRVPKNDRTFAVQNLLISWLARIRQPTADEAIAYASNAILPDTHESMSFRSIVQCAAHVAEAVHGVSIDTNPMTLVRILAAYVDAQVGESFGFTLDAMKRAAQEVPSESTSE